MRRMKAVVMQEPGGCEVLRIAEVALEWPAGPRDVLVNLRCAGLNPADLYFRAEGPYVGDGRGCILGHDGAGVVAGVGPEVERFTPGDAVCFCYGGIGAAPGTYAEFAVVPEDLLSRKPEGVSFAEAAALPLVFITLWESLAERARVKVGDSVLIHAGAGGTGHVGVQIAQRLGARVAATVSSREKAEFIAGLGAERPILYPQEDFCAAAREWTSGDGLDVALDNVGGDVLKRTFAAMRTYGRVVTLMGMPGDAEGDVAYNSNLTIHNVMMLTPMWRGLADRLREQAGMVRRGLAWLAERQLSIHVEQAYPLDQAAAAHRRLEAGGMKGKLVLVISE